MGIVLALLSSVLWGIADFAGGTASRRLPSMLVVLASQGAGLVVAAIVTLVAGAWIDPTGYVPWAIAAGLVGVTGLLAFYQALAVGTMGVVSPIAALGVVVPVVAGLVTGNWPHVIVIIGILLAIIGIVAASGPERSAGRSLVPVALAIVAAVCFGTTLLFIARGAAYSPLMTMVTMRVASVIPLTAIYLIVRSRRTRQTAPATDDGVRAITWITGTWLIVVTAGVFDVGANLAFAIASTAGALTIVAILGSLYPAMTVLLARIVHSERLTRLQQIGVAIAMAGVALIAGWS